MADIKEILDILDGKAAFIESRLTNFEEMIIRAAKRLDRSVIEDFISTLATKDGVLLDTQENTNKLAALDRIWAKFQMTEGVRLITTFVSDLDKIVQLGADYYTTLIPSNVHSDAIKKIIDKRLGIVRKRGGTWEAEPKGYVAMLIEDRSTLSEIRKTAFSSMAGREGPKTLERSLNGLILGQEGKGGAYSNFFNRFAMDSYTEIDRLNSRLHARRLKLQYFLYNGGLVRDSREFCKARHGKCFSTEEAEQWRALIGKTKLIQGKTKMRRVPIGPIVEDAATYNPLIDLGGIRCRHSADYVSDDIAKDLRAEP